VPDLPDLDSADRQLVSFSITQEFTTANDKNWCTNGAGATDINDLSTDGLYMNDAVGRKPHV
jgi:hypothetical protein